MEILKRVIFLFMVATIAVTGCKKKSASVPLAEESDCDSFCGKIEQCAEALYTPTGRAKSQLAHQAVKFYKNKTKCVAHCKRRVAAEKKRGGALPGRYRFFIGKQVGCVDGTSCKEFAQCQERAHDQAISEYPLDEVTATRCDAVCEKRNTCAQAILPRSLGQAFLKEPEDKQAAIIRKWSDKVRCVKTCRLNFIKGPNENRGIIVSGKRDPKVFLDEFSRYLNCLGHKECNAFAQCATSQTF